MTHQEFDLSALTDRLQDRPDLDLVREMVTFLYQALIDQEATEQIGAEPHERSLTRTTRRNGSRPRRLSSKAGDLALTIPKLIGRIMHEERLVGLPLHKKGRRNLKNVATSEDRVNRKFTAATPNQLWLTDVTEHKTREGTLYCCVVLDMCSRRIVGWAIDRRNDAVLANDALAMAASSRVSSPQTILHSDHGSGFTSWSFTQSLKHHQLLGSMGTIGDCFDNAPMESFWGSMQIELLNRKRWVTFVELATAMADYIENFYNPSRRHSSLDYLTPDEFEAIAFKDNQARTLAGVAQ
jgi:transposase InsO family protein